MSSQDDRETELQRLERQLKEREHALRLREIEAEINQPPVYETVKHKEGERAPKRWYGKLVPIVQFLGIVVAVVVAMRVAAALAYVFIVGAISWIAYKLFLERDRTKS